MFIQHFYRLSTRNEFCIDLKAIFKKTLEAISIWLLSRKDHCIAMEMLQH